MSPSLGPTLARARPISSLATKIAGYALCACIGFAVGNFDTTDEALHGSEHYYVHTYCPKIAAKAAASAVKIDRAKRPQLAPD